ncbi:hypothetical protein L6R50_00770 [Myxococcota bacterium]|nr:hypothetical protein [Myxococcota bacterium]
MAAAPSSPVLATLALLLVAGCAASGPDAEPTADGDGSEADPATEGIVEDPAGADGEDTTAPPLDTDGLADPDGPWNRGELPDTWDEVSGGYDSVLRWYGTSSSGSVCTTLHLQPSACSPAEVLIGASWPWVGADGTKRVWVLEADTWRSSFSDTWSEPVGPPISASSAAEAAAKARDLAESFMQARYYDVDLDREPRTLVEWTSSATGGSWIAY